MKELTIYLIFIMIVYIISYGNRDPKSFMFKEALENNFVKKNRFDEVIGKSDNRHVSYV